MDPNLQINPNKDENSLLRVFPVEALGKMIQHIDRFDPDVGSVSAKQTNDVIEKLDEISEQIIEDNL